MPNRQPLMRPAHMEEDDEDDEYFHDEGKVKRKRCDWRCVLLVLICVLFIFLLFLIIFQLIKKDDLQIDKVKQEKFVKTIMNKSHVSSEEEMCQLLTGGSWDAGGNSSRVVGNENIFFLLHDPRLTLLEACSVESVLRLTPDKTVYMIDLSGNITIKTKLRKNEENTGFIEEEEEEEEEEEDGEEETDYINRLLKLYRNLDLMKIDRNQFFQNTFVNDKAMKCCNSDKIRFVMKLLAAYKFGGVVFSTDLLMRNRLFMDMDYDTVKLDRSIIMVPDKCNTYLYYLYEVFKHCDIFKDVGLTLQEVIKKSLDLYCGNEEAHVQGCSGIKLFSDYEICDRFDSSCSLVRIDGCSNTQLLHQLPKFCRQVVKAYIGPTLDRKEVEEEQNKVLYELEKPSTPKAPGTCECPTR